jgi:uncharacterized protein (DUF305 family)
MKNHILVINAIATILLLTSTPSQANSLSDNQTMPAMEHKNIQSDFTKGMMQMHKAMNEIKPTGNIDIDFVRGMIPHHQGAIDMAIIELNKGKDPEIRKLAADIIEAQKKEISLMKKWLLLNGVK